MRSVSIEYSSVVASSGLGADTTLRFLDCLFKASRPDLVAGSGLGGALPPVLLRAVCFIRNGFCEIAPNLGFDVVSSSLVSLRPSPGSSCRTDFPVCFLYPHYQHDMYFHHHY